MSAAPLSALLDEYEVAQTWSAALTDGLTEDQVQWRPDENSSAIAWHLGHQGAVNHFMVRNLTAAEVSFNRGFDAIFDSATPEPGRGELPSVEAIMAYRASIAQSTKRTIEMIASGNVGAPNQLPVIANAMIKSIINHEYQHAKWIGEVRDTFLGTPAPEPASSNLAQIDGYWMVR